MTKEELKQEAEKKYCNGCKWRIEQCLWAWRNTNGLNEPNEKNCSCKEVPAYIASAEPREKRIAELEAQIEKMKCCSNCDNWNWKHNKCEKKLKGDCFKHSKWVMRNF